MSLPWIRAVQFILKCHVKFGLPRIVNSKKFVTLDATTMHQFFSLIFFFFQMQFRKAYGKCWEKITCHVKALLKWKVLSNFSKLPVVSQEKKAQNTNLLKFPKRESHLHFRSWPIDEPDFLLLCASFSFLISGPFVQYIPKRAVVVTFWHWPGGLVHLSKV